MKKPVMLVNNEPPRIMTTKCLLIVPALMVVFLLMKMSALYAAEEYLNNNTSTIVDEVELDKKPVNFLIKTIEEALDRDIETNRPLIILNWKKKSIKVLKKINDPETIESIDILNGSTDVIELFGEKAANGVVIVLSKEINNKSKKGKFESMVKKMKRPLIIFDWKQVTKKDLNKIEPEDIESFSILGKRTAAKVFGRKISDGSIIILSKQRHSYRIVNSTNNK